MGKLIEDKENYTLSEVGKVVNLFVKYKSLFDEAKNTFNSTKRRYEEGFAGKKVRESIPNKLIEVQNLILKDYKKYIPIHFRKEVGLDLEKKIEKHISEIECFKKEILVNRVKGLVKVDNGNGDE